METKSLLIFCFSNDTEGLNRMGKAPWKDRVMWYMNGRCTRRDTSSRGVGLEKARRVPK